MEEKKQHPTLTIDRAAFLLLRVKKAFKKKLQKREREKNAQLVAAAAARTDQRASCVGLEGASRANKKPPPLLRSRTLPAIVVPGVNILQAQLGNYNQDAQSPILGHRVGLTSRYHSVKGWDDTVALDVRRKSAISRLCSSSSSSNHGTERGTDGTLLLRVPAPHVVAARAYRISSPSTSGTGLYKLTRLLNQGSKNQVIVDDTNVTRRLSWERRDHLNSKLPRSSSIDSMVEAVWAESIAESSPLGKRSSLRPDRPLALVSPSVGRRMKGQRGINDRRRTTVNGVATNNLKRSKSVRASLRLIGNKFLNQKFNDNNTTAARMQKSPSLSSINEQRNFKRNYFDDDNTTYNMARGVEKRQVETILKTPMDTIEKKHYFRKKFEKHVTISQPPSIVAPKAAAILQIPQNSISHRESSKENFCIERNNWFPYGNVKECDLQGRYKEFRNSENGFQRTSLRLSINTNARRNTVWNGSFSSTSKLATLSSKDEMEVKNGPLSAGLPPLSHKPTKKQAKLMQERLERLARVNIHLQALFAAVEHGHLEKARTILESTDVDVNSLSNDGLSPLDIAVLSNNRTLVKMLIGFGAREGNQFSSPEMLGSHLKHLLSEAEMRLQELGGLLEEPSFTPPLNTRASFSSIIGNAYPASTMTGCTGGDTEKQAVAWGRRVKILRRLVLGFSQARPPDPPSLVTLDIIASSLVALRLQEPLSSESPITTKFKVQWSTKADFTPVTGETEIFDMSKQHCAVELTQGRRYFFRAACGNVKGYGTFLSSIPAAVIPSSWREVDKREPRFERRLEQLEELVEEVRLVRPGSEMLETPGPQRRAQRKKTTIKQLFSAASKFQKNLKRGIYLACILYHEDKVLVTNEDFLPVIEIDETFPSCLHTDHHWLMKVACTWDDTKSLRADMEKHASSLVHFRTKLLSAALQMQSALCLQDLGQLYFKPLRDSQGTVALSTINYVKSPKSVSVLNSRWLPMNKVFKKVVLSDDHNISEILMASIQEQINYHQVSGLKLSKGLYLAYLKMQSSVDSIQIVVPAKTPNMLPHCKIRDNPHVCAEEWEHLKKQHLLLDFIDDDVSEQQKTFLELITSAAKRLFNYMDISNEDALVHRLYDSEIIDLTEEVSFIVICPSAELSCSVPGQREILLQRGDLLSLPIQVFEMIHLNTYQNNILQKYAKLSCLLELDAATATHMHREAFSNSELVVAKERLAQLEQLQIKLNNVWRSVRWLMDLVIFARDRYASGMSVKHILSKESDAHTISTSLLQIPPRDAKITKSTPGRGSWPGPAATNLNANNSLMNEFSKSEQQLSKNETAASSQYLLTGSSSQSRKNSDSYSSGYFHERLPPSRSEDMLFTGIPTSSNHRCRASTISSISATSSPLLSIRPLYSGSLLSVNTLNTNTSDSLHSLSSDSDSIQGPLSSSTPNKIKNKPKIVPSRSMTNVKQNNSELKSDKCHSKNLNVKTFNLETTTSKSLTDIKRQIEVDACTYIKPMDAFKKSKHNDPAFKVPYSDLSDNAAGTSKATNPPGILQVYAAYETGLASGTSLKLHVTSRTTAREVVDLVVKQLNMAVVLKGKDGPVYAADKLKNFCLVAVIGARERCLRDDFKPLQLQNPWKRGRLYVRQKQDVLAALEHSTKHSQLI